jgi:hypothetical protein
MTHDLEGLERIGFGGSDASNAATENRGIFPIRRITTPMLGVLRDDHRVASEPWLVIGALGGSAADGDEDLQEIVASAL